MISDAYTLQFYQLEGQPEGAYRGIADGCDIAAKIPAGATRDQFRLMLQALLKERFGLEVKWEKLPREAWAITANGKTRSVPASSKSKRSLQPQYQNGRMHLIMTGQPIGTLAAYLTTMLHGPVADETDITGEYDFTLDFSPDWLGTMALPRSADDTSPTLQSAMTQQLGLKLEHRVIPQDILRVIQIQRDPVSS